MSSNPEQVDEALRFAIANKRLLELRYKDKRRHVEPHDYGRREKVWLLVYQLRTWPSDGKPAVGWRQLEVAQIQDVKILADTFTGSRGAGYKHHLKWDVVYARVK